MKPPVRYPRPATLAELGPGHHVIEASAGTGKTYLLEHLFVDLVLSGSVAPDEILVVTYTEKAVAELVVRIRALIERLVGLRADDKEAHKAASLPAHETWILDHRARTRLQTALLGFDQLSIFTIHAFCQRILREHAFAQNRLFEEELVDEQSPHRLAFRDVLRTELASDSTTARALSGYLGSGGTVADLENLVVECLAKRQATLVVRFDEERFGKCLQAWPILDDEELLRRMTAAKVHGSSKKPVLGRYRTISDCIAANPRDPIAVLANAVRGDEDLYDMLSSLTSSLAKRAADPLLTPLVKAVADLLATTSPLKTVIAEMLVPRTKELAARRKRQAGQLDYSDMLDLVNEAMSTDTETGRALLATLRRRYRRALIDEFQDTDDVQWSIFRRIFVDADRTHALTVIGDPKQSIYRFRGADVRTYLDACATLVATGAKAVTLDRNYRSSKEMIDAVNLIFEQQAGLFRPGGGISYDRPVGCGREDVRLIDESGAVPHPVLLLAPESSSDKLSADEARAMVRAGIVAELRSLLAPDCPLRLHDHKGEHRLRERDVFVLTFSNNESRDMGSALAAAGIPFAFYKIGELFESPEASDVLSLLRAVAAPSDARLRARALLTHFFGMDLARAATQVHADAPSTHLLYELAAIADKGDIPNLFSAIVERTGVIRRQMVLQTGERSLTNTLHLFEILQGEWARSHRALPELVELLDALINKTRTLPGADGDLQRLETDRDAVQILTVHKSKGLEAAVVFVYGGTGNGKSHGCHVFHQQGQRVLKVGPLDPDDSQLVEREEEDERSRLLYVACTRARVRLVLPHYPSTFETLAGTYCRLNQRLDAIAEGATTATRALFRDVTVRDEAAASDRSATMSDAVHARQLADQAADLISPAPPPDVVAIRERRAGFWTTSYTAVKQAHGGYVPPDDHADVKTAPEAATAHVVDDATDSLPGGAATGIFLHEILASVSLAELHDAPTVEAWMDRPSVRPLLDSLAKRHDRPEKDLAPAARLVHTAATSPVRLGNARIAKLAAVSPMLREMQFHFPIPEAAHPLLSRPPASDGSHPWKIERGVVKGFIDVLLEHEGRVYVCDWKSDALTNFDATALVRHCRQNYDVQARIYTLATLRLCGIADEADYVRRFGGVVFFFLRGKRADDDRTGIHFECPSWHDILSWERDMLGSEFWGFSR